MFNANQLPPHVFNLEGIFLGFMGSDLLKPKALMLEVEQERLAIKLPKELRSRVRKWLTLGDRLQCIGCSWIDYKAGVIKLQAYQIFVRNSAIDQRSLAPTPAIASVTSDEVGLCSIFQGDDRPSAVESAKAQAGQKQAKILVCYKSGCQKRGGRRLISALEEVLKKHQLEDQVQVHYTGCQKRCAQSPSLTIMPGRHRYDSLSLTDLPSVIEEHFCKVELG